MPDCASLSTGDTSKRGQGRRVGVASTVETVRRVAARITSWTIRNSSEAAALEAFEQAAAAIHLFSPRDTYRQRPELRDRRRGVLVSYAAGGTRSAWAPRSRADLSLRSATLRTFEWQPLGGGALGESKPPIAPGDEVSGYISEEDHAGMRLSDIASRGEHVIAKVDGGDGHNQLHPAHP